MVTEKLFTFAYYGSQMLLRVIMGLVLVGALAYFSFSHHCSVFQIKTFDTIQQGC